MTTLLGTPDPMDEAELLGAVVEMARLFKWQVHHDRPARTQQGWRTAIIGHAGFPDLVLARQGRILFFEVKTMRGVLEAPQGRWAVALGGSGVEERDWERVLDGSGSYAVLRPAHWRSGMVEAVLRGE